MKCGYLLFFIHTAKFEVMALLNESENVAFVLQIANSEGSDVFYDNGNLMCTHNEFLGGTDDPSGTAEFIEVKEFMVAEEASGRAQFSGEEFTGGEEPSGESVIIGLSESSGDAEFTEGRKSPGETDFTGRADFVKEAESSGELNMPLQLAEEDGN